jgi:hypothetical protein
MWPYIESETILLSETDMIANTIKELAGIEKRSNRRYLIPVVMIIELGGKTMSRYLVLWEPKFSQ